MRLREGETAPAFTVQTVEAATISLSDFVGRPVLLMFFRYASCPMCNLRLHDLSRDLPHLRETGLEAIAFFHSSNKRVAASAGTRRYPLHLVGDPDRTIYSAYGVEKSWSRLLLSSAMPSFYVDWMRSTRHGFWGGMDLEMQTMPADFLVTPDGRIARAHYGSHIGDHLSINEVREFSESVAPKVTGR